MSITEPGGYLQWDEGDPSTTSARSPSPDISAAACKQLIGMLDHYGKMFKMLTE